VSFPASSRLEARIPKQPGWLLSTLILAALAGPVAAQDLPFVPTLTTVMTFSQIIGSGTFGGDVSINAYGKWIAASPLGVFISTGTANTTRQQVFAGESYSTPDGLWNSSRISVREVGGEYSSWLMVTPAIMRNSSNPMCRRREVC
jgi:hypothetical protein